MTSVCTNRYTNRDAPLQNKHNITQLQSELCSWMADLCDISLIVNNHTDRRFEQPMIPQTRRNPAGHLSNVRGEELLIGTLIDLIKRSCMVLRSQAALQHAYLCLYDLVLVLRPHITSMAEVRPSPSQTSSAPRFCTIDRSHDAFQRHESLDASQHPLRFVTIFQSSTAELTRTFTVGLRARPLCAHACVSSTHNDIYLI